LPSVQPSFPPRIPGAKNLPEVFRPNDGGSEMIVREIVARPDLVLPKFDYFNDYKDTRNWLKGSDHLNILNSLDNGYKEWEERRKNESRTNLL